MPPTNLLLGKSAIITGGTTGIGRAITLAYIRQGANVIVNHLGRDQDAHHLASLIAEAEAMRPGTAAAATATATATAGSLFPLAGDVSDPETGTKLAEEAVRRFGRLDVCVSNAGVCEFAEFLRMEGDLMRRTVRTNLEGGFYVVQAAARVMAAQYEADREGGREAKGGAIIGISSISALVGGGRQVHYTPTKAGVLSLMQSCAVALGKYGIRCNAILPGTVETRLNEEDLKEEGKRRYMEGRVPLGRIGRPEDVAGPAVFLACEELSGYVTGAQLLVDGGLFVNLQ
ncbi:NAD(P)-binding protein [Xylaria sp. CBS 124048]|nr:NAD(P)-binding protein [Xylaria sp. CBS 124048]